MTTRQVSLYQLAPKKEAIIRQILGGHRLIHKLQVMGIRKGKKIVMASKQPFRGPVTIKLDGREITLGRGMAKKIIVEVIP